MSIKELNTTATENMSVSLACRVDMALDVEEPAMGNKPRQRLQVSDGAGIDDVIWLVLWDTPYFNQYRTGDVIGLKNCRLHMYEGEREIIRSYNGIVKLVEKAEDEKEIKEVVNKAQGETLQTVFQ